MNWKRNLALAMLLVPTIKPVGGTMKATDVSGTWQWKEEDIIMFPPFVAGIFGVEPEGPTTHATCELSGTLSLIQASDTFTGFASQVTLCTTRGGQQFDPFPALVPFEGVIEGASMHIDFGGCRHAASIETDNGVAVSMNGNGHCKLRGHPGALTSVSFEASR